MTQLWRAVIPAIHEAAHSIPLLTHNEHSESPLLGSAHKYMTNKEYRHMTRHSRLQVVAPGEPSLRQTQQSISSQPSIWSSYKNDDIPVTYLISQFRLLALAPATEEVAVGMIVAAAFASCSARIEALARAIASPRAQKGAPQLGSLLGSFFGMSW